MLVRVAAVAVVLAFGSACGDAEDAVPGADTAPPDRSSRPVSVDDWREHRAVVDETVWSTGNEARVYEARLVALWDALIAAGRSGDPAASLAVLGDVEFETLTLGRPEPVASLGHGIERLAFAAPHRDLDPSAWRAWLDDLARQGYELVQTEWHHARFQPGSDTEAPRSRVAVVLHVARPGADERIAIDGELVVTWSPRRDADGIPLPSHIDATGVRVLRREGPPLFERVLVHEAPSREDAYAGIHPLLLYDLDEDGHLDVVLARAGEVLRGTAEGTLLAEPLAAHPYLLTQAAVVADLDGDGNADLLASRARGDLVLYAGDGAGRFPDEPKVVAFEEPLRAPSALSVGDVDGDGDLDVWLAQYKPAYQDGQMPTPWYDANDGYPSHLLLNDGAGNLTSATHGAGLDAKRHRRTYASSFVDLDDDGDLDLLVVSDYSGVDLYHNDGTGHFEDANATLLGDRQLFGMSAALADYDLDGRLDVFVAGMASTTARRFEALGLWRDESPELREMRSRMAFGNRLYLAGEEGWTEPAFRDQVARTGWTWGTTAFDFDNDGDPDLFAANGHQSGESTQDYCETFWRHDIYDGASEPDPALAELFGEVSAGVAEGRESWDGYQKNHLLMNLAGEGFVNVAFLLGVADEFDSRAAVSGDLDLDGRVDLLVTEASGRHPERLHVFRNVNPNPGAWIGVRLLDEVGVSPVGASVTVQTPGRRAVARVVTGETLMGQHAPVLHFGLGDASSVEAIEVRWVDGRTARLEAPALGRYHLVRPD